MRKQNIIFIFLIEALSVTTTFCQNKNEKLISIRKIVQEINKDTSLKSIKLENEEFLEQALDGGGSLTGYFNGDSLVKITEWVGLSFGSKQFEYYFKKEKLVFVYATEKHFRYNDSLQTLDQTKLELTYEGRYYFANEKLFDSKTSVIGAWDEPKILSQSLVETANKYLQLLKKKKNNTRTLPASH